MFINRLIEVTNPIDKQWLIKHLLATVPTIPNDYCKNPDCYNGNCLECWNKKIKKSVIDDSKKVFDKLSKLKEECKTICSECVQWHSEWGHTTVPLKPKPEKVSVPRKICKDSNWNRDHLKVHIMSIELKVNEILKYLEDTK